MRWIFLAEEDNGIFSLILQLSLNAKEVKGEGLISCDTMTKISRQKSLEFIIESLHIIKTWLSCWFLWVVYSMVTKKRTRYQQLTYLWHIYFVARGMQQQLRPGSSWMNGRPTHLLLMFDQPLWFLWYIYSIAVVCSINWAQESTGWMEGPRISYSCLISHCGFYDIFIL